MDAHKVPQSRSFREPDLSNKLRPLTKALDWLQRLAASSSIGVRLAVAVRNQCRCIIKYRLAESPNAAETGERWLIERVSAFGTNFVDVGANSGDWLTLLAKTCGDQTYAAIAFEPSASAFSRLSAAFDPEPRVTLRNTALGDTIGELSFFEEADAGKGSTFVPGFLKTSGSVHIVRVTTLVTALEEQSWDHVDLLKIDAEGYDLRVLVGAQQMLESKRIEVIQFEYNRAWQLAGDTLSAAYRLLEGAGFRVFVLKLDGLYDLNYALYEEYFEYTNFVAISKAVLPRFEDAFRGLI